MLCLSFIWKQSYHSTHPRLTSIELTDRLEGLHPRQPTLYTATSPIIWFPLYPFMTHFLAPCLLLLITVLSSRVWPASIVNFPLLHPWIISQRKCSAFSLIVDNDHWSINHIEQMAQLKSLKTGIQLDFDANYVQ